MPIPFSCSSCGRSLNVRDELAGREIYCPDCKSILTVPLDAPPELEPEMAVVAAPAAHDDLSTRAEEPPPPPRHEEPAAAEEFDDEPPRRTQRPTPPENGGPRIGAVIGGAAMMVGAFVLVLIGLSTGLWIIKGIVLLGIAGLVTFIKGLMGKTD
jgi:hypothetical protein